MNSLILIISPLIRLLLLVENRPVLENHIHLSRILLLQILLVLQVVLRLQFPYKDLHLYILLEH